MNWKSPRCSAACWDEIQAHEARLQKTLQALLDMKRDRDEWKEQHENLLVMYRAALPVRPEAPAGVRAETIEECARICNQISINAERRAAGHTSSEAKQAATDKCAAAQACEHAIRALTQQEGGGA